VKGLFACVTCQFRIRNRGALPACPDCGEIVWAYMEDGPRPVPEGEAPDAAAAPTTPAAPSVEEGVKLEESAEAPVKVEEGVKLEP
jgi:predicted  nucleic acid-binding Zn-ribbon protein